MDKSLLTLYSAAHFWMDFSCALLLFRTLMGAPDLALCLLVYNFCAFALQMPFGLLADRFDRNGAVAAAGCAVAALAYLSPLPLLTAAAAGIGNALFHVGGGIDVLNACEKKLAPLGVFVAPGALGVWLGALCGKGTLPALWLGSLGLLALGGAIWRLCRRRFGPALRSGNAPLALNAPAGLGPLPPLFLAALLQSYVGLNQRFDWSAAGRWVHLLALAAVLGKAVSGFLADAAGPRRAGIGALGLAAALYLASALPLPGILATACFNVTLPIALWAAAGTLPGAKGFAYGLLKFGLFLGYLPSALEGRSLLTGPWAYAAVAAASLVLLLPAVGKKVARC